MVAHFLHSFMNSLVALVVMALIRACVSSVSKAWQLKHHLGVNETEDGINIQRAIILRFLNDADYSSCKLDVFEYGYVDASKLSNQDVLCYRFRSNVVCRRGLAVRDEANWIQAALLKSGIKEMVACVKKFIQDLPPTDNQDSNTTVLGTEKTTSQSTVSSTVSKMPIVTTVPVPTIARPASSIAKVPPVRTMQTKQPLVTVVATTAPGKGPGVNPLGIPPTHQSCNREGFKCVLACTMTCEGQPSTVRPHEENSTDSLTDPNFGPAPVWVEFSPNPEEVSADEKSERNRRFFLIMLVLFIVHVIIIFLLGILIGMLIAVRSKAARNRRGKKTSDKKVEKNPTIGYLSKKPLPPPTPPPQTKPEPSHPSLGKDKPAKLPFYSTEKCTQSAEEVERKKKSPDVQQREQRQLLQSSQPQPPTPPPPAPRISVERTAKTPGMPDAERLPEKNPDERSPAYPLQRSETYASGRDAGMDYFQVSKPQGGREPQQKKARVLKSYALF